MTEAAASKQEQPGNPIQGYLAGLCIGRKQSFRNMEIYPLIAKGSGQLEYMLLDQALTGDLIRITELDRSGSVPELKLKNKSGKKILILDGEELIGAKQNRIVNTTILIAGKASTVIPVSCVEQGRWSQETESFGSGRRMMYAAARAMKADHVVDCLRSTGTFDADQSAVWDEIDGRICSRGACSESNAMSSIYEKEEVPLEKYGSRFRPVDGQVGAVFAINGRIAGVECFGKPDTLQAIFDKLVRSYALDAIDWYDQDPGRKSEKGDDENTAGKQPKTGRAHARRFLDSARTAPLETRGSVSLGQDHRLQAPGLTGFALTHEGELLHLSLFARTRDDGNRDGNRGGNRDGGADPDANGEPDANGDPDANGEPPHRQARMQRFGRRIR